MLSTLNQNIDNLNTLKSPLALSIFLFLFLFSFNTSSFAQQSYHIQCLDQEAQSIVNLLEKELSLKFNYNHDYLPEGKFTFSASGKQKDILSVSSTILDRKFIQLDQGIYTIQNVPLDPSDKVIPTRLFGTIKDEYGETLTGTNVWIASLKQGTQSDVNGQFEMTGYFDTFADIEISYLGYETSTFKIARLLQSKHPVIVLKTKAHLLSNIEIVDYLSWNDNSSNNNSDIIRLEKTMSIPGKFDADVLSIAQVLPGIYSASESVSEIQIRGGSPDQTHFEWNNIQIFQTSHFFGKISSINPFLVDQISINKNGGSAEDSGQASGKIALSNQTKNIDSLSVRLHSNLLYSNVGLRLPLFNKKVKMELAWRKSYSNFFNSVVYDRFFNQSIQNGKIRDDEYYQELFNLEEIISLESNNNFQDLIGSIHWQISPKDDLTLSALKLDNVLTYKKTDTGVDDNLVDSLILRNSGLSLNYERKWNTQLQTKVKWSTSNYENRYRYLSNADRPSISFFEDQQFNKINQSVFQFSNQYQNRFFKASIGYQHERWHQQNFSSSRDTVNYYLYFDYNIKSYENSAFAQVLLHTSPIWQIEAGLRWSKYSRAREQLLNPRFHFSIFPAKAWTIHGHLGWYHQVLNQSSTHTTLQVEGRFWYLSEETNPEEWLFVVRNRQVGVGVRYQKKPWTISADIYHKRIRDIFSPTLDFSFLSDPYRYGDMHIKGLELALQFEQKYFSFIWTYDYVDDEMITDDGNRFQSHFSQPHRISLLQSLQFKKWSLSLHWKYATGRPFSIPRELKTTTNNNGTTSYSLEFDELLTERISNYHTMDLSLNYKLENKKRSSFYGQLGLSINNLYNRQNIISNRYFIDYKQDPIATSLFTKQGLPFTPNISLDLFFN